LAFALPAAAAVAVAGAVGLTFAGRKVLTAGRRPTGSGVEALRGAKATVRAGERGAGQVAVAGGLWGARLAWPQGRLRHRRRGGGSDPRRAPRRTVGDGGMTALITVLVVLAVLAVLLAGSSIRILR